MGEITNLGVPNGNRVETEMGGLPPRFTEIRFVSGKKFDILVERGSALVKQGIRFSIFTIYSQLGVRRGAMAFFLSKSSSIGSGPMGAPSCAEQVSFLAEDFTIGTLLGPTISARGIDIGKVSRTSVSWVSSEQGLLAGGVATAIDSERH